MNNSNCFDRETYKEKSGLSEQQLEAIDKFDALFVDWTKRLNLVAKSTIEDRWFRHYYDSSQMLSLLPSDAKVIMDFGSGGGFPGLFLAILSKYDPARPHQEFYLVESIAKKCAFLREVKNQLGLDNLTVLNERIERVSKPKKADVITARALADLSKLLHYAFPFLKNSSSCLFMKGEKADLEISAASKNWSFDVEKHQSMTSPTGKILSIRNVARVD